MSDLTIGLLSALLATNQPQAISNLVQQQTGVSVEVDNTRDPEENELRQLMMEDDAAIAEVNDWINTNSIAPTNAPALKDFNRRIRTRLDVVSKDYQNFLNAHPNSARGYLAYGSFLNDSGDEDGAVVQYENSKQLDPKNPAVWNNLANYYGENGELTNAFADYTEAIRLNPTEPVYYQNFATTVYLYRKDAKEYYHIDEGQVFDKALGLYQQAMKLDPANLVLATDYAMSYYGIRPLRTNDALVAWTNAYAIARDDNERSGVMIHLARVKMSAGFYDEALGQLNAITNAAFADQRDRLKRSVAEHRAISLAATNLPAMTTNSPATTNPPPSATNTVPINTNPPSLIAPPPVPSVLKQP